MKTMNLNITNLVLNTRMLVNTLCIRTNRSGIADFRFTKS